MAVGDKDSAAVVRLVVLMGGPWVGILVVAGSGEGAGVQLAVECHSLVPAVLLIMKISIDMRRDLIGYRTKCSQNLRNVWLGHVRDCALSRGAHLDVWLAILVVTDVAQLL